MKVRKWPKTVKLVALLMMLSVLPPGESLVFAENAAATAQGQRTVALETVALGPDTAYACQVPVLFVIRDQEDWQRVWNLHHGREASQHQLPDIDFELFSVIALFAGRSAGVEGVEIVRFEHNEDNGMTVHAVEVEPGLGCTGPKMTRKPFHIVRIPAVKKNAVPSLEIELLSRHCVR